MSPGPDRSFSFGATKAVQSVYSQFLSQLFALVEGTIDNSKFEDQCRSLLGNKVFTLFVVKIL